jgi:uncharacterized membrane protein
VSKLVDFQLYLNAVILWIHLFAAAFFVGGSFFFWLVVVPASRLIATDESERTQMVGKMAKVFGKTVTPTLVVLVLTGIYNASWYAPAISDLLRYPGTILLAKIILVVILLIFVYVHNLYFGRRITAVARERKVDELRKIRKTSRVISAANLILMAVILLLAVLMQMPP